MTEREKMAQIIAEHLCPQGKVHKTLYGAARRCYSRNNFADCEKVSECVDALIEAGIGDMTEWKERAKKHRVIALPCGRIKQLYSDEEVEQIAKERDELKERADSEIKSCYKEIAEKRDEIAKLRKQLKRAQNADKKQKHRAEVAERALRRKCEIEADSTCPCDENSEKCKECAEKRLCSTKYATQCYYEKAIQQAEREIEEEKGE